MSTTATAEPNQEVIYETAVVPLGAIEPPTANVREDFGDLDGLAETIRESGLLENFVVFRLGEDQYRLIAGERRYRAAQLAKCTMVPVSIRPEPTELERIELQLIENGQRLDLGIPEVFAAVQGMFDLGASEDRVAQVIGQPADEVSVLRGIISLGQPVLDLIASGDLSLADAAPLAPLSGLGAEYIEHAVECIHHGWNVVAAARQAKDKHRHDQLVAEATAMAQRRKLTLIDPPKYGTFEYGKIRRLGSGPASQYLDLPIKEHSKEPCHAAYIDPHARTAKAAVVVVCTDPAKHRPAGAPPVMDDHVQVIHARGELSPGQKAAQTRQHRKDWAATHTSRNITVTAVVQSLSDDEAKGRVARHVLEEGIVSDGEWAMAARLLGIAELNPTAELEKVVRALAEESGEKALRVALAVLTARAEHDFQKKDGLGYHGGDAGDRRNVREHFRLLQRHGHVLKDAEVNHLDRYCGLRGFTAGDAGELLPADQNEEETDGVLGDDDIDGLDHDQADAA
jgi:ParB/RepB/Spo0J family partition protein